MEWHSPRGGDGSARVTGFPRWMKPKSGRHLRRVRTYLDTMASVCVVTTGLLRVVYHTPLGKARVKTAAGGAELRAVTVMISPEVRSECGRPCGGVLAKEVMVIEDEEEFMLVGRDSMTIEEMKQACTDVAAQFDAIEGRQHRDRLVFEPAREIIDAAAATQAQVSAEWAQAAKQATATAVDGEEPGGLMDVPLRAPEISPFARLDPKALEGLRQAVAAGPDSLPGGPAYETPESNPPGWRENVEQFDTHRWHSKVAEWEAMDPRPDGLILDVQRNGCGVQWLEPVVQDKEPRNGGCAREHPAAMVHYVLKGVREGAYRARRREEVDAVLPFNLAPKPSADPPWRLIQNAMVLNDLYEKWRVKFESCKTIPLVVEPGWYCFTLDLRAGYHHVRLTEELARMCGGKIWLTAAEFTALSEEGLIPGGVTWDVRDGGWLYVTAEVLTFGLAHSVPVFTKITRQMCRVWRKRGYRLGHLLDDFLFAAPTYEQACELRDVVVHDLQRWGWFINFEKSQLNPAQCVRWIGVVIDTVTMRFYMPGDKIEKLEGALRVFVADPTICTYRDLARIAGKVISMGVAILPARMMSREFFTLIRPSKHDWDDLILEDATSVLRVMTWWLQHLRAWNSVGAPIRPDYRMTQLRLWVDAGSNYGYRLDGQERSVEWTRDSLAVAADWEDNDGEMHHVHKEMKAVLLAVEAEVDRLRGKRVLLLVDAMATVRYLVNGTGKSEILREMTMQLWELCIRHGIALWAEHVSGEVMILSGTDSLSRFHEFMVARRIFNMLHARTGWGVYTVDMWASHKTHQVKRWLRRGGGDGSDDSLGDARTFTFADADVVWAVPPLPMIAWTLVRLRQSRVRATVVVPIWHGQSWFAWRTLAQHEMVLSWSRTSPVCVDVSADLHRHEVNRWQFVAWSFDFRDSATFRAGGPVSVGRSAVMSLVSKGKRKQPLGLRQRGPDEPAQSRRQHRHVQHLVVADNTGEQQLGVGDTGQSLSRQRRVSPAVEGAAGEQRLGVEASKGRRRVTEGATGQLQLCTASEEQRQPISINDATTSEWQLAIDSVQPPRSQEQHELIVLSVFDGAASLLLACESAGIPLREYWRLEIDPVANALVSARAPQAKLVGNGDVTCVTGGEIGEDFPVWSTVDALVFGFPCQDVSVANRLAVGLQGARSRLFFEALRIWRAVRAANPKLKFVCECVAQWASWLHTDYDSVGELLGVLPVVHDSKDHSFCHRARAIWANFDVPVLHRSGFDARSVLEPGRTIRASPDSEAKLPTVMASLNSYNQSTAVFDYQLGQWTPPSIREAERAMGLPEGFTGGDEWALSDRWRLVGNGFNLHTFAHIMSQLYLAWVRDAVLQRGSPFEENQDGPSDVEKALRAMRRLAQELKGTGENRTYRSRALKAAVRRSRGSTRQTRGGWPTIEAGPETMVLTRRGGTLNTSGMNLEAYVHAVRSDLRVLARAPSTWSAYAAWWNLFKAWLRHRGMGRTEFDPGLATDELKNLVALMARKYAYSTLQMLVNAVNAVVQDAGYDSLRDRELTALLKGVANHKGRTPRKKMAILPGHVRAALDLQKPSGQSMLTWVRDLAVLMLGWYGFLRVMEAICLDTCDIAIKDGGVLLHVRYAKADQSRDGRFTMIQAGQEASYCPVARLRTWMKIAGVAKRSGCTKGLPGCGDCGRPKCVCDCAVCGPLFRQLKWDRVSEGRLTHGTVSRGLKVLFAELERIGAVEPGTLHDVSGISMRAGGVTSAAALDIGRELLQGHGRWMGEMSVLHYDRGIVGRFKPVTKTLYDAVLGA